MVGPHRGALEVPLLVRAEVAEFEHADRERQSDECAEQAGEDGSEEGGGEPVRYRERRPREQTERHHFERRSDGALFAEKARHHRHADERHGDADDDVVGRRPRPDLGDPARDGKRCLRGDRRANRLTRSERVLQSDDERGADRAEGDRHEVARERDHDGRERREAQAHEQGTDDRRWRPEARCTLDERSHQEHQQHHLYPAVLADGGEPLTDGVERAGLLQRIK